MTHWIIRIASGSNFERSKHFQMFGLKEQMVSAIPGDTLWFVVSGNQQQAIAVATFVSCRERNLQDLLSGTYSNIELGWTDGDQDWRYEIHYENLIDITNCNVFTQIVGQKVVRKYNSRTRNCAEELDRIYPQIVRFSRAVCHS